MYTKKIMLIIHRLLLIIPFQNTMLLPTLTPLSAAPAEISLTPRTLADTKLTQQVEAPLPIHLDNGHAVDQRVIVAPLQKDPTNCTQLHGRKFLDCMACQSAENLKRNIMDCNDRMAHYYFLNIRLEEYYETVQNFTDQDWATFYASRTPEARENFPKTIEEQRAMLKAIYIHAYFYNYFEYIWSGQSASKTDDLHQLIRDYNSRRASGGIPCDCNLYNRFHCLRKQLFSKPHC